VGFWNAFAVVAVIVGAFYLHIFLSPKDKM
jgi:hypothetical protein